MRRRGHYSGTSNAQMGTLHLCEGPEAGNWKAVGEAIIERTGELQRRAPGQFGQFLQAAWHQPDDEEANDET
jgi:hypothetical protein